LNFSNKKEENIQRGFQIQIYIHKFRKKKPQLRFMVENKQNNGNPLIPDEHPRAKSLHYRHKLVDGMHKKIVTPSGLCAHGRGEAFDYLLGEESPTISNYSKTAAVAAILTAKHPIISVNGNVAALIPNEIVEFSKITKAPLEINLFYQAPGRIEAIEKTLRDAGAEQILGINTENSTEIPGLKSNRRVVDKDGIAAADVVLVPLEDGDRTESLIKNGKLVIAIDLNPLSRTAIKAHITIVDNVIRCISDMSNIAKSLLEKIKSNPEEYEKIKTIVNNFNQKKNLNDSLEEMIKYLQKRVNES
jgi:4-phosphopantoate---beta-alanine ligase